MSDKGLYFFIVFTLIVQIGGYSKEKYWAKRFHKDYEPDMDEAKRNKKLPKVIRKHFGLKDRAVQFLTLEKYVFTYCQFWIIFILPVLALLLKPVYYFWVYIFLVVIEVIWKYIMFIFFQTPASYYVTKNKRKNRDKSKKVTFKELCQEFISDMKIFSEFFSFDDKRISQLFDNMIKITKLRKKKRYISKDNLDHFEKTLYPKYQKHFIYEITSENEKTNVLMIYLKKRNRLAMKVYIEKN